MKDVFLYLDFDGPLHPDEVYLKGGEPALYAEGELFMHAGALENILGNFNNIRIILSTSWVKILGFDKAKSALPKTLQERVTGATYHTALKHQFPDYRYDQIHWHVRRHNIENWIALDNDDFGWADEHRDHLVLVDNMIGLGDPDAQDDLYNKLAAMTRQARAVCTC